MTRLDELNVEDWGKAIDSVLAAINKVREATADYYNHVGMLSVDQVIEARERMLLECDNLSHASLELELMQPFWGLKLNKAKEQAMSQAVAKTSTKTEAREVYKSQDIFAQTQKTYDLITNVISAGKTVIRSAHKLTDGMSHKTKDHSYNGFTKSEQVGQEFRKGSVRRS